MAAWAYECRPAGNTDERWYVACLAVDAMPATTHIVRVHVEGDWRCATVDRRQRTAIDAMHLRDVVASDEADCPECARAPASAPAPVAAEAAEEIDGAGRQVDAAAVSLQGHRFMVVLVGLDLVGRPGEADMAITDLRPRFGGVDVVLMGQEEDGTPVYAGDPLLVGLLAHVPVDRMPWKKYPIG